PALLSLQQRPEGSDEARHPVALLWRSKAGRIGAGDLSPRIPRADRRTGAGRTDPDAHLSDHRRPDPAALAQPQRAGAEPPRPAQPAGLAAVGAHPRLSTARAGRGDPLPASTTTGRRSGGTRRRSALGAAPAGLRGAADPP